MIENPDEANRLSAKISKQMVNAVINGTIAGKPNFTDFTAFSHEINNKRLLLVENNLPVVIDRNINTEEPAPKRICRDIDKQLEAMFQAILTLIRSSNIPRDKLTESNNNSQKSIHAIIEEIYSTLDKEPKPFSLDNVINTGILSNQMFSPADVNDIDSFTIFLLNKNKQQAYNYELLNYALEIIKNLMHFEKQPYGHLSTVKNALMSAKEIISPSIPPINDFSLCVSALLSTKKVILPSMPLSNGYQDRQFTFPSRLNSSIIDMQKPSYPKKPQPAEVKKKQASAAVNTATLNCLVSLLYTSTDGKYFSLSEESYLYSDINKILHVLSNRLGYSSIQGYIKNIPSACLKHHLINNASKQFFLRGIDYLLSQKEKLENKTLQSTALISSLVTMKILLESNYAVKGNITLIQEALILIAEIIDEPKILKNETYEQFYAKIKDWPWIKLKISIRGKPGLTDALKTEKNIAWLPKLEDSQSNISSDQQSSNNDEILVDDDDIIDITPHKKLVPIYSTNTVSPFFKPSGHQHAPDNPVIKSNNFIQAIPPKNPNNVKK